MKTLEKNVINLFGQKGKIWLNSLPATIDKLSESWSLTNIQPMNNMSWNYVATAIQHNKMAVVLKISCDKQIVLDEYKALKYFNGDGIIQVLDYNSEHNAILLEQAIPGTALKSLHPTKITETINIYVDLVNKISIKPLPRDDHYKHVNEWLKAIDRITDNRVEKRFIDKACELRSRILNTAKHEYVCHGDLHLENIIKHGSNWLAIDAKGIIGEKAFEAAAFDLISKEEIKENKQISSLLFERIALLSNSLKIDKERLLAWVFLRIIMSAQWFIEDNGNPDDMLILAHYLYPL